MAQKMAYRQIVRLRGTANELTNGLLQLVSEPPNPNGGKYHNVLPIDVSGLPKTKLKGIVGKRLEIVGQLRNLPKVDGEPNVSVFVPFKDYFGIYEGDMPDTNSAHLCGDVPSGVIYEEPKYGKRAFSNILMLISGTFIWAVAFRHYARQIKDRCPRGSVLELKGRLNFRTYEDSEGQMREVYEIVADGETLNVLKRGVEVDELADLGDLGTMGEIVVDDDAAEPETVI